MKIRVVASILWILAGATSLLAQSEKSPPEETKITFEDHIKPIFREHCSACHSESDKESDLALDSYGATLAGGSSGQVIVEGNADASRLFKLITHAEQPYMPPDQDPIPKEQMALIKTWIEQGMPENAGSKIKRNNAAAASLLGNVTTGRPEGPPPMPQSLLREPVQETPRSAAISALAASPWAPLIALGGQQQVSLYHAETGQLLGVLPFPEGEPQSLVFTRDGRQLLIGGGRHGHSGCAVLVDVATGERIAKVGDELDIVLAADITPDKQRIALAGPQKIIRVFDTVTGEVVLQLKKHTDWVYTLRYSPDGILLASGDRSNGLLVWEADTGTLYADLRGHKGEIRSLDFRPDSNVLASSSLDGTVKLWDMFESKEIKSWNAHGGGVHAIAYAQSGLIATGGGDAKVKVWDGNGGLKKEFTGLSEMVLEVAITGDGKYVAGGDWNGNVRLWPVEDPAAAHPVAANPPSIHTRLKQAQTALDAIRAELDSAQQVAAAAQSAAQQSVAKTQSLQQESQQVMQQLATATKAAEALSQQVAKYDSEIQALEEKLAAARAAREQAAGQLAARKQEVQAMQERQAALTEQLSAAQAQQEKLAAAAQTAEQRRAALEARLTAAQAELEQAQADKAALDAYAQTLRQEAEQASARLTELTAKAESVKQQKEEEQKRATEMESQLAELKAQLAELQQRVEALAAQQTAVTASLAEKSQLVSQLEQELESAQQAALMAQEKLQLFEASYHHPQ
ncbi:MAG: hypothetical protein D6753_06180 [Planctomycetota bacterium]|nr:MAG: hypothetical protein D6753_06180 [Planctomycetota bacterium]